MRRVLALAALLAALTAVLAPPAGAKVRTVRAFAVGPRFGLDWVDTPGHFRDHLLGLVRRDVEPHLSGRDLVTFPEDLGLLAAFSGTRGAVARQAPDLVSAILGLVGTYAPVNAHYAARFPALAQRGLPVRLLAVSLTDTFARAAVETAAEVARRTHAYVVSGAILPRSWRVVCTDRATFRPPPGSTGCDAQDPALVALLRSPDEPARDYAYEATTDKASNLALVFDPSGRLISKQVKTYLVPDELPGALDLVPGSVSGGLSAVETRLGRLGIVTSKDAWMPDVLDRLDEARVDLLVQPEFFVGDTLRTTGMWAADTIAAAGYSAVLREPSFAGMVLPSLTGNVLDLSADNQSQVAVKPRSAAAPRERLAGGIPLPGLAAVAPTAVRDPLAQGILQRRHALGLAGEAQLPSGPACPTIPGPCRGGQVEAVVWHDVRVGTPARRRVAVRRHGRAPFGPDRPLAPAARGPQRHVALAARGRRVWAALESGGHVLIARSRDAGRSWSRPRDLGRGRWPAVAPGWVAFERDGRVLRARDGAAPRPVGGDARQSRPAIGAGGFTAWIDERGRFADDDLPRADVYGARPGARAVRIDTAPPSNPLAAKLDHDWAPAVAVRGRDVLVAWTDFGGYDWRVVAARSSDGGRSFRAPQPLDDTPADLEALDDAPAAAFDGATPRVAFTRYAKVRDPQPAPLYDVVVGGPGRAPRQVDGHGVAQVDSFAPALAPPFVAWQDHPRGLAQVRVRRLGGRALRVRDAGARGNAWRPALARAGGRLVVAWEDERERVPRIYVTTAAQRAVR